MDFISIETKARHWRMRMGGGVSADVLVWNVIKANLWIDNWIRTNGIWMVFAWVFYRHAHIAGTIRFRWAACVWAVRWWIGWHNSVQSGLFEWSPWAWSQFRIRFLRLCRSSRLFHLGCDDHHHQRRGCGRGRGRGGDRPLPLSFRRFVSLAPW